MDTFSVCVCACESGLDDAMYFPGWTWGRASEEVIDYYSLPAEIEELELSKELLDEVNFLSACARGES